VGAWVDDIIDPEMGNGPVTRFNIFGKLGAACFIIGLVTVGHLPNRWLSVALIVLAPIILLGLDNLWYMRKQKRILEAQRRAKAAGA
jgi:Flp pilus assembly protein TadB